MINMIDKIMKNIHYFFYLELIMCTVNMGNEAVNNSQKKNCNIATGNINSSLYEIDVVELCKIFKGLNLLTDEKIDATNKKDVKLKINDNIYMIEKYNIPDFIKIAQSIQFSFSDKQKIEAISKLNDFEIKDDLLYYINILLQNKRIKAMFHQEETQQIKKKGTKFINSILGIKKKEETPFYKNPLFFLISLGLMGGFCFYYYTIRKKTTPNPEIDN